MDIIKSLCKLVEWFAGLFIVSVFVVCVRLDTLDFYEYDAMSGDSREFSSVSGEIYH